MKPRFSIKALLKDTENTTNRRESTARSRIGVASALVAAAAAFWLLSTYIHACRVTPVEKAFVDSLKEKAKTNSEVQKVLQPELDRQHESLVVRRNAYRRGGLTLLISLGIYLAWHKWLRPAPLVFAAGDLRNQPPRRKSRRAFLH